MLGREQHNRIKYYVGRLEVGVKVGNTIRYSMVKRLPIMQSIISGAVTRKIGVKVFDGTETELWTVQSNRVYAQMDNIGIVVKTGSDTLRMICTHSSNAVVNTLGAVFIFFTTADYDISTAADWNAFISTQYAAGTPVILVYPLAEEIAETTAAQPMKTVEGNNEISVTANVRHTKFDVEYKEKSEAEAALGMIQKWCGCACAAKYDGLPEWG